MPLASVWATAVPKKYAPANSKILAKRIALVGLRALVEITVATIFAESLNPLESAKARAKMTTTMPIIKGSIYSFSGGVNPAPYFLMPFLTVFLKLFL